MNNERVLIDLYNRLGRQIDNIHQSLTLNGLTEDAPEAAFLSMKYHNTRPDCVWDDSNNEIYSYAQKILEVLELQRQSVAMWIHFYRCRRDIATCPEEWEDFLAWDKRELEKQYALFEVAID